MVRVYSALQAGCFQRGLRLAVGKVALGGLPTKAGLVTLLPEGFRPL